MDRASKNPPGSPLTVNFLLEHAQQTDLKIYKIKEICPNRQTGLFNSICPKCWKQSACPQVVHRKLRSVTPNLESDKPFDLGRDLSKVDGNKT